MYEDLSDTILTYMTRMRNTPLSQNLWQELEKYFKIRSHKLRTLQKFAREGEGTPSPGDKEKLRKYILELLQEEEPFRNFVFTLFRINPV